MVSMFDTGCMTYYIVAFTENPLEVMWCKSPLGGLIQAHSYHSSNLS